MSAFTGYQRQKEFWEVLELWRRSLQHNLGQRAELRRAKTGDDVFLSPAFQRGLLPWLREQGFPLGREDQRRLALGAGLLSHVTRPLSGNTTFAGQLAAAPTGGEAVRDVRFKRLLATDDPDDLYLLRLRLVRYLDGAANVPSLVRGAFYWNEKVKRQWAEEYYTG